MGTVELHTRDMLPALVLSASLALAAAAPYPALYYPDTGEVVYRVPRQINRADDLLTAADTGYAAPGPVGRVKIQAYRGPSKGEGYDVFAPWGYYNTQPADLSKATYH